MESYMYNEILLYLDGAHPYMKKSETSYKDVIFKIQDLETNKTS